MRSGDLSRRSLVGGSRRSCGLRPRFPAPGARRSRRCAESKRLGDGRLRSADVPAQVGQCGGQRPALASRNHPGKAVRCECLSDHHPRSAGPAASSRKDPANAPIGGSCRNRCRTRARACLTGHDAHHLRRPSRPSARRRRRALGLGSRSPRAEMPRARVVRGGGHGAVRTRRVAPADAVEPRIRQVRSLEVGCRQVCIR